jgi:hypothetical protein
VANLSKCDIARGSHIPLELSGPQRAVLAQFFLAYKASHRYADDTVAVAVSKFWQLSCVS